MFKHFLNILVLNTRSIHVSPICANLKRESRIISKMINPATKRKWYSSAQESVLVPAKTLGQTKRQHGKNASRRVSVLNKLFMRNISDLLATSSISAEILGRGIEISNVSVTEDFNFVNVYWVSKGAEEAASTAAVLGRVAGALRHELSQLRLMGQVPHIVFVQDTEGETLNEIDRRLARADFGDDFVPRGVGHLLKTEIKVQMKLPVEVKEKIRKLEENSPPEDDFDEAIPAMTHTVYGLDHAALAGQLAAARARSRQAWTRLDQAGAQSPAEPRTADDVETNARRAAENRAHLRSFLVKRQAEVDRLQKEARSRKEELQIAYQMKRAMEGDDSHQQEYDYHDDDYEESYDNPYDEK